VWVADHLALSTQVAVKLIDPELAKKESARERFRREATAAAQLRSAHVVQILDHGIDNNQPFIVMELLEGEDLFERLAHRRRLTLRETSRIVTQVARALTRAHAARIVHRDLKPENVFLVTHEDEEIVKVLDFGVAKVSDPAKATMQRTGVGTLIGTPHYMSPEQVKGIGEVDARTDLWGLGVIAYQCVTGELPFDSEGVGDLLIKISIGEIPVPSKVLPSLPAAFDAWFARACERDREKRFQSAREMAVALAAVVNGENPKSPSMRPPAFGSNTPTRPAPPPRPAAPKPPKNQAAAELLDSNLLQDIEDEDSSWGDTDIDFDIDEPEQPPAKAEGGQPMWEAAPSAPTQASPPAPAPSAPAAPSSPHPAVAPPPPSSPASANPFLPTPPQQPTIRAADTGFGVSPAAPAMTQPTTVSGLSRPGLLPTDPPPELDGSRRRRMVRILVIGLVLGAIGLAFSVVRSQLGSFSTAGPSELESASATPPPPPPPPTTPPSAAAPTASAVDPGKVKRPVRPTPVGTPKPRPAPRPKAPTSPPDDNTIVIPDPPGDAVPPAP